VRTVNGVTAAVGEGEVDIPDRRRSPTRARRKCLASPATCMRRLGMRAAWREPAPRNGRE
jgi:hypothetical protein